MINQMLKEFKQFALRGNVVDLAVGVVVGGAFGKIVSSIVADIVMPPLGMLLGGINLSSLKWVLKESDEGVAMVSINYGNFLQTTVDFLIISASIFVAIKMLNKLRRTEELKPKEQQVLPPSKEVELLTEIRDSLKSKE